MKKRIRIQYGKLITKRFMILFGQNYVIALIMLLSQIINLVLDRVVKRESMIGLR